MFSSRRFISPQAQYAPHWRKMFLANLMLPILKFLFVSIISISYCGITIAEPQADSLQFNEQGVAAMRAKDLVRAEDLFKRAVEMDPQNLTAVYNYSGAMLVNKKVPQALSLLQDYAKRDLKDAGLFFRLGEAQFANKDTKNALISFEKAQQLDPKMGAVYQRLGTLYSLNNRLLDAERAFAKAVEFNQKDFSSLSSLATLMLANGKAEEAVRTSRRALQLTPNVEVYITLGSAYQKLGKDKEAIIAFQRAADLAPAREDIKEIIQQLQQKQG